MQNFKIRHRKFTQETARKLEREGFSSLMARVFSARGIKSASEIENTLSQLLRPNTLKGLEQAIRILIEVINNKDKVVIVGDYDCDGATATAMAVRFFRSLAIPVQYIVPNRETMGYGLSTKVVELILPMNPNLVITVDNGIASVEAISILIQQNIKVIVTDHHLPAKTLPPATAIVNPNQPNCGFDSKNLSGVGVFFYILIALRQELIRRGMANFSLAQYLDLVAVGTIADLVPLDKNNRILVANGLKRIRKNNANAGIRALIKISGLSTNRISCSDIGFYLSPRINAAGRLADMTIGIETLLTDDDECANELAKTLNNINLERRAIESQIKGEAIEILRNTKSLALNENSVVNSLYNPDWHLGVVGIVAARIKEQSNKPTFIFADAKHTNSPKQIVRGSGRSVDGLHLRDCLDLMSKEHPQLFITFGGHAMAAGASLYAENINLFRESFSKYAKLLCHNTSDPIIETDGQIYPADFNLSNVRAIDENIWGQGFPPPLFFDSFVVDKWQNIKDNHWKVFVHNDRLKTKALYFNAPEEFMPNPTMSEISFLFTIFANEYQGQVDLQLKINKIIKLD